MAYTDITGQRFTRLVALERDQARKGWLCACDCGAKTIAALGKLTGGHVKSCGCWRRERNRLPLKHGKSSYANRLYRIWSGMRARCKISSASGYENYGARGVRVCAAWDDFAAFDAWAHASGYADDKSIDRIDPAGNYEPANCRWATRQEQNNNKRSSVVVKVDGITATAKEHATRAGVSYWSFIKMLQHRKIDPQFALDELRSRL